MDVVNRLPWRSVCLLIVFYLLAKGSDKAFGQSTGGSVPSSASNTPQTVEAKPADVDAGNIDKLLDLVDKGNVNQLSQLNVSSQTGSFSLNLSADTVGEANSLGEILRQVPGINSRRLSGINFDPQIRGYNSSQLNATADGMNQLKTRVDIDSLFSQIDPGIVSEVTVIDGPYTSLYGPGFAFLVGNLIPTPRYATPQVHLSTNFVYGSNAQTLYTRDNVVTGGTNWGTFCSYGLRDANNYTSGGEGFTVPSGYQKWDGMLSTSYDLNGYSRIEFEYLHTDMNNVELPGVIYDLASSINSQFNLQYVVQKERDGPKVLVAQAWHSETFYRGNALNESKQQTFYKTFVTDTYQAYTPPGPPVNTSSNGFLTSTGVRLLRTLGQTDAPQWTIGTDWRRYEQRYQELELASDGQISISGIYFGIPQSSMDDVGVLTNLELPLNDRLKATIGGRVDYATAGLNLDDPIITQFPIYVDSGLNMPSYCLGMAYGNISLKLNETDTVTAGTGFAMRPPNLSELYTFEPFTPFCNLGNSWTSGLSDLAPEKDWQFDLGITCDRSPVHYGARGFYALVWDYIMPVPWWTMAYPPSTLYLGRNFRNFTYREDLWWPSTVNGDTIAAGYQIENIPLASLCGGDLFAEWKVRPGFSLLGNISYINGRNLTPVEYLYSLPNALHGTLVRLPGQESLPNIYPLNGRLTIRFSDPEANKWGAELAARFVHDQDEVATGLSELRTPGFSVFDLRGYYFVRKNVRLTAEIQNLFNRYYTEPGSLVIIGPDNTPIRLPEPGINCLLGIDARF
jgi:iron complex outermembrane receptor protein